MSTIPILGCVSVILLVLLFVALSCVVKGNRAHGKKMEELARRIESIQVKSRPSDKRANLFSFLKKNPLVSPGSLNDPTERSIVRERLTDLITLTKSDFKIADFTVICDENNNPPLVVDANELAVDLFIQWKPSGNWYLYTNTHRPDLWIEKLNFWHTNP